MTKTKIGMYLWDIARCGTVRETAKKCRSAGIDNVLVKVADGIYSYQAVWVPGMIEALIDEGITVWGWQYVYGALPEEEAKKALEMISAYNLSRFIINAEMQYKNRPTQAKTYCKALRAGAPEVSLALSSYRFPSLHTEFPWKEFLSFVDINMPQVYWVGAHNPARQLERCLDEFDNPKYPPIPIIPTGAAYKDNSITEDGKFWKATPGDVREFLNAVDANNLKECNFWELGNCWLYVPELWEVIRDYNGCVSGSEPEKPVEIQAERPRSEATVWQMELTSEVQSWLNLRQGPGTQHPITGRLYPGETAYVLELDDDQAPQIWARVGVRQWCAMTYVKDGRVVQYGRFVTE